MNGLIYKDIRIMRPYFIGVLTMSVFGILLCTFKSEDPDMMMLMNLAHLLGTFMVFAGFDTMTTNVFEPEYKVVQKQYYSCIPDGVKGYIRSKYVFCIIFSLIMLAVIEVVNIVGVSRVPERMDLKVIDILVFDFMLIQTSIGMPFIARYGAKAGNAYRTVFFVLIILTVMIYLLFGDLSFFGSFDHVLESLQNIKGKLENNSDSLKKVCVVSTIVTAITFCISYLVTCKAFRSALEKCE